MNFTRESIFVGAIRSFCSSLATILGLALGIGIVAIALAILIGPSYLPPKADPMVMPDAQGARALLPGNTPAVLRIDFRGEIGVGDLTSDKIQNLLLDSREDLLKGNRVKAVFLYLDTPGGSATDADAIYRAILAYKTQYNIPVYAFVDGLCASGGMYIACAADKIYATASSVIGSVGVIMGPTFNFSEAMTKIGVSALTLTEGKDKDALNPFRPWKTNEDASLKDVMARLYDRFVTIVATARPQLSKEKLVSEYGAHVFIAQKAQTLGYIDQADSDYSQALSALAEAAHLKDKYQVIRLTPQHPLLDGLTYAYFPQKLLQWMGVSAPVNHDLSGKLLYLYQP